MIWGLLIGAVLFFLWMFFFPGVLYWTKNNPYTIHQLKASNLLTAREAIPDMEVRDWFFSAGHNPHFKVDFYGIMLEAKMVVVTVLGVSYAYIKYNVAKDSLDQIKREQAALEQEPTDQEIP
jgi:hypothetical protein